MTKLLSLIIPTYNMATLLPRCLDSLVAAPSAHRLDVIVVNDGSKDNSLAVAQDYATRYANTIRVINKPNGNYGSTINSALPQAEGLYVKILDSDDLFDTTALEQLLSFIDSLSTSDPLPDVLHTPFTQISSGGQREVIRYNTMGKEPYTYKHTYRLDDILGDGYIRFFLMHAIAYRTAMLRSYHYTQTEGISYTDTEWATIPFFYAQTICFLPYNVYLYHLDRAGQTMAPEVLLKSTHQLLQVNDRLLHEYDLWLHHDYYNEPTRDDQIPASTPLHNACEDNQDNQANKDNQSTHHSDKDHINTIRHQWFKKYFENRIRILYKIYLLDMPRADFDEQAMEALDNKLSAQCEMFHLHPKLYPENKLLRIEYIHYWHTHHHRWPIALERFNHLLDRIVKWLYVRLFRK